MVYSLVYDETHTQGQGVEPWVWLFETHLPTTGWTCTLLGDDDEPGINLSNQEDHFFFLKKTMEFIDGTTADISFCIELEPIQKDFHLYGWDGVKATNDDSDPEYGRSDDVYSDTTFNGLYGGAVKIWADETDSWFITTDGNMRGWWLPNGGWIRNEYPHNPGVGNRKVSDQLITALCFDDDNAIFYGNSRQNVGNNLPLIEADKNMLTDYVMITSKDTSTGRWAVWRDVSNQMLMRAGPVNLDFDASKTRTVRIDDASGSTYYWGPGNSLAAGANGIFFNMGNTDPGY